MIDGTALILLGTLILVALGRAAYRAIFEKGWHRGRAALLREQHSPGTPAWARDEERLIAGSMRVQGLTNVRVSVAPYDQEADA